MYIRRVSCLSTIIKSYRPIEIPLSPFFSSVLSVSPQRSFGGPAVHMILADPLAFTPFPFSSSLIWTACLISQPLGLPHPQGCIFIPYIAAHIHCLHKFNTNLVDLVLLSSKNFRMCISMHNMMCLLFSSLTPSLPTWHMIQCVVKGSIA